MFLIAARAVQGFAGAILLALSMSLLRDLAPQGWLGGAMGLLGTTSALGTAFGPSLGGALLSWLGWRAAFWGLTGVAAVTLVLALGLLPHRAARTRARLRDMDRLSVISCRKQHRGACNNRRGQTRARIGSARIIAQPWPDDRGL